MANDGPHLNTAMICERILNEQDGVVSAIRIIDRVTFGADPDGNLLNPQYPVTLFIGFRAGSARGRHSLSLQVEKPSGEQIPLLTAPMHFEGEERGANVFFAMPFEPDQEGLYWFDVILGEERVTRIPLRAVYQPMATTGHAV